MVSGYNFSKVDALEYWKKSILKKRAALLEHAYENILEIGIGEGTNLSLYPTEITYITAVDAYPIILYHRIIQDGEVLLIGVTSYQLKVFKK